MDTDRRNISALICLIFAVIAGMAVTGATSIVVETAREHTTGDNEGFVACMLLLLAFGMAGLVSIIVIMMMLTELKIELKEGQRVAPVPGSKSEPDEPEPWLEEIFSGDLGHRKYSYKDILDRQWRNK